ncbi:MAG: HNH endonuclease [Patescibacteria group bacterium]
MPTSRCRPAHNRCRRCGERLTCRNRTGLCRGACYDAYRRATNLPCSDCGGPLGQSNTSGMCRRCNARRASAVSPATGARGAANPMWRGGRRVDERGYVRVRGLRGQRYGREHRSVVEVLMGRPLAPREVVHHVDGDPGNNDPANLEVYRSNGYHRAAHRHGTKIGRVWPLS